MEESRGGSGGGSDSSPALEERPRPAKKNLLQGYLIRAALAPHPKELNAEKVGHVEEERFGEVDRLQGYDRRTKR